MIIILFIIIIIVIIIITLIYIAVSKHCFSFFVQTFCSKGVEKGLTYY